MNEMNEETTYGLPKILTSNAEYLSQLETRVKKLEMENAKMKEQLVYFPDAIETKR